MLAPVQPLEYESISTKMPFETVFGVPVCFVTDDEPARNPVADTIAVEWRPHLIVVLAEKLVAACVPENDCFSTTAALAGLPMDVIINAEPNTRAILGCMQTSGLGLWDRRL
jgi:hypothetical protein